MIKNYLKISLRYLIRQKEYTVINIVGLAVSITCCMLIMLFVRSELSYDAFHSKADRLYRVWQREKTDNKTTDNVYTSLPMAGAIKSNFAEVENTCRIYSFNPIVKVNQKAFADNIDMVDASFFDMFDFRIIEGSYHNPFSLDNSIVITPETAKKYFGNSEAIGKNVKITFRSDTVLFTVSAIVNEAPEASSIKYHALISFANARHAFRPAALNNWFNVSSETFVLLKPGVFPSVIAKKFPAMMKQQLGSDYGKEDFTLHMQPIKDIHLNTSLPSSKESTSDPKYSYILSTIGFLILIVACINFITLSIGQSTKRAMEVGVRKALGAARKQLVFQFWVQALIVVVLSVIIGLLLSVGLLKPFNTLINRQLVFQFDLFSVLFCIMLIVAVALISGIYPAVILSGFKPIEVLKGKINIIGSKGWLRQGLVIGQFVTSIVMIIGTIVIFQQMHYLKTKNLGYKKEEVVVVETHKLFNDGFSLAALYRNELLKHPQVLNVTVSVYSFAETPWVTLGYENETKQPKTFQYNAIDPGFVPTMGIKIIKGRNFEVGNTTDIAGTALVNEAYVKEFNLTDPIGKKLPKPFPQIIVGVVKDFNFESLHTKIQPLVMSVNPDALMGISGHILFGAPPQPRISIQLKKGNLADNIAMLKDAWNTIAPGQNFDYKFLDESIAAQYKQDQRTDSIVQIASGLSIFIACMGLYGLATLSVVKRIKEIGIRKVFGANVGSIVRLLSVDFVKLVFIAAVIASPIAWWAMNRWLQDFTYRVEINWWVFILAGLAAMLIALVTISYQTIKTALANPVKSLKTE